MEKGYDLSYSIEDRLGRMGCFFLHMSAGHLLPYLNARLLCHISLIFVLTIEGQLSLLSCAMRMGTDNLSRTCTDSFWLMTGPLMTVQNYDQPEKENLWAGFKVPTVGLPPWSCGYISAGRHPSHMHNHLQHSMITWLPFTMVLLKTNTSLPIVNHWFA